MIDIHCVMFLLLNAESKVKFEGFRIGQGIKVAVLPESYHSLQPGEGKVWFLKLLRGS